MERLCKLGGISFVTKMVDLFISYCGERVAAVRAAQKGGDLSGVTDSAHPIKSSAGNIGAVQVQEIAAKIEMAAKEGNSMPLEGWVTELESAFAAAKTQLQADLTKLATQQSGS